MDVHFGHFYTCTFHERTVSYCIKEQTHKLLLFQKHMIWTLLFGRCTCMYRYTLSSVLNEVVKANEGRVICSLFVKESIISTTLIRVNNGIIAGSDLVSFQHTGIFILSTNRSPILQSISIFQFTYWIN